MEDKLRSFLAACKCKKSENYTHITMDCPEISAGKYCIPADKLKTFHSLYCKSVALGNRLTIGEKPSELTPFRADFDFYYKNPLGKAAKQLEKATIGRKYTKAFLIKLAKVYQDIIKEIAEDTSGIFRDTLSCVILEKSGPFPIENIGETKTLMPRIKDGFHIHFPKFICDMYTMDYIREQAISRTIAMDLWEEIDADGEPEKIIDNISRHVWMMYGSMNYKGEYSEFYRYTRDSSQSLGLVLNYKGKEIGLGELFEEELVGNEETGVYYMLPILLSIQNYTIPIQLTERFNRLKKAKIAQRCPHIIRKRTDVQIAEELKMIKEHNLLEMLNKERADRECHWIDIGWTLFNVGEGCEEALEMWIEFSRRSEKFKEGECEKKWQRMKLRPNKTIMSLVWMAKADNPGAFQKVFNDSVEDLIEKSLKHNNPTPAGVAQVVCKMACARFKCAAPRKKNWYEFRDHRWREMEGEVPLRKFIIEIVGQKYLEYRAKLNKLQSKAGITSAEYEPLQKKINKITTLLELIETRFLDSVVKFCELEMTDLKFMEKLNENRDIIGCENGVLDLEFGAFRDGTPDDNVTFSTGINYREFDEDDEEFKMCMDFFKKMFVNKQLFDYNLAFTALALKGRNTHKLFLILTGPNGNNGKSTYINILEEALGDYIGKFPRETVIMSRGNAAGTARPDLARVAGKRLMVVDEATRTEKINMGVIKQLTGNDSFFTRNLFEKGMDLKPFFTLICQCNEPPSVPESDGPLWERIRLVNCESQFIKPNDFENIQVPENEGEQFKQKIFHADLEFAEKIPSIAPAVLYLLFKTATTQDSRNISEPDVVKLATKEYRKSNDVYHKFVGENVHSVNPLQKLNYFIKPSEMLRSFNTWYKYNYKNMDAIPKHLIERGLLKEIGLKKTEKDDYGFDIGLNKWMGLSLIENAGRDESTEQMGVTEESVLGD